MFRFFSLLCSVLLSGVIIAQPSNDTFRLYFELGKPDLDRVAAARLDSLMYYDIINPATKLVIVGYADHIGDKESNKILSENRSQRVLDYLLQMGMPKDNVKKCLGEGEVARAVEKERGYPVDRRVDVVIDRITMQRMKLQKATKPSVKTAIPVSAQKEKPAAAAAPPPPTAATPAPVPPKPASPAPDFSKIDISKMKPGETMVLDKIYFYSGRHFIREESTAELKKLYFALVEDPDLRIQIEGHVCCVNGIDALDEDTFELALSVNRAKYIYQFLIKNGIAADRLRYKGFGRTRPAVTQERTLDDENRNRRVEIRVLE